MPLAPHLRPTPAGSPDPSSVLSGPGWRIQVLTQRLVRIEWSPSGVFEDRPTQVVSRRDFPALPQPPRVERHRRGDGEEIRVSTPYLTLTYDGGDFSPQGLCVQARRGAQWGGSWRWGVTEEGTDLHFRNLGGTARTLDNVDGRIALEPGIMDGRGVAALVDDTPAITEEGWVELREAGSRDVYLFVHGDRIAARVDLKADRAGGVLQVQSAWLEDGCQPDATAAALASELHLMAGWLGLTDVAVLDRGTLAAELRNHA